MWILAIIIIYFILRGLCVWFTRNKILSLENKFCKQYKTKYRFVYYDSLPNFVLMLLNITKGLEYYTPTENDLKSIYEIETVS